jgi:5-methylcytosine-specific restriction endonuclease McrA
MGSKDSKDSKDSKISKISKVSRGCNSMLDYNTIMQQIDAEMGECECKTARLTYKIRQDGQSQYRYQCPECGKGGDMLKQSSLTPAMKDRAVGWDDEIRARYYQARSKRYEEIRQTERDQSRREWFAEHDAYLRSADWHRIRDRVLRRDNRTCRGCLEAPASEVHHLTYDNHGDELAYQLVSLCHACHEKAENAKRARRGA